MIRRPPRSTLSSSSAASDVYKRQLQDRIKGLEKQEHKIATLEANLRTTAVASLGTTLGQLHTVKLHGWVSNWVQGAQDHHRSTVMAQSKAMDEFKSSLMSCGLSKLILFDHACRARELKSWLHQCQKQQRTSMAAEQAGTISNLEVSLANLMAQSKKDAELHQQEIQSIRENPDQTS
eukprot:TRINITY_DN19344_c0_g1_i4.p2 TRINITY_DN19344_c0_g1~~TRINITY_DN19344_c0_g1_i4.p2  ORF type:complete len:178 (+),score=50.22 TRINITY_DN19344_c0_g1_i4:144-677(+)